MERTRDACLLNAQDLKQNNTDDVDNFYSPRFLDAYIMSATALEAFINERIAINLEICKRRLASYEPDEQSTTDDKNQIKILKKLKGYGLRKKYLEMPTLLWQTHYDEDKYPFEDFSLLVSIRNDIIHYTMPFYDEQDVQPPWVEKLTEKDIFLHEPVIHPPEPLSDEGHRIWIEEICTLKGAKWAHNTSCAMMKQFARLARGMTQSACQDYVDSLDEL
jgi:hypothetical protein